MLILKIKFFYLKGVEMQMYYCSMLPKSSIVNRFFSNMAHLKAKIFKFFCLPKNFEKFLSIQLYFWKEKFGSFFDGDGARCRDLTPARWFVYSSIFLTLLTIIKKNEEITKWCYFHTLRNNYQNFLAYKKNFKILAFKWAIFEKNRLTIDDFGSMLQ